MSDSLTLCPRCTSDACYETKNNDTTLWFCYGCGFYSNSTLNADNPDLSNITEHLPELYKDLKYTDEAGHVWFPYFYNNPQTGMIFADGKGTIDWKWAAVLAVKVGVEEQSKFPGQMFRMDLKTIKHFDEKDFMDALDYIGYFNK